MRYYQNFSFGCYLYLALHGSYGFLWIMKDLTFGDKNFENKGSIPELIGLNVFLYCYWLLPYFLISGDGIQDTSPARVITAVMLYVFGVSIMLVSDAQ
jgi:hypothetical protein